MKLINSLTLSLVVLLATGCRNNTTYPAEERGGYSRQQIGELSKEYGPPVHLADLEDKAIRESSGIVASHSNPDLFWTHNDSGGGPILFAVDRRGRTQATWSVTGARAVDWEAIAIAPGTRPGSAFLYVGDIGDNSGRRREIVVYRVPEPLVAPSGTATTKSAPQKTEPVEAIHLRYPDGKHDAESLAVHPASGDLYVITKTRSMTTGAAVYKLTPPFSLSSVNTLKKVADISIPGLFPGMITAADISPDGRKVIMCDYFNGFELNLSEGSGGFNDIWKEKIAIIRLGLRPQGEAICYRLDGRAIVATSEKRPARLIEVELKH